MMRRQRSESAGVIAYNCPCCGGPLAYGAESGRLECAACSNSYEPEALEAMQAPADAGEVHFDMPTETFEQSDDIQAYICESCGAELLTQETTTATECPYCGSPTILPENIEGGVKPEMVVPFAVAKEEAQAQFDNYFKGKKLLPNIFLETRNRIAEMRKLYVPYWLFDCGAYGDISYDAKIRHAPRRMGDWEIIDTDHYIVRRAGRMEFDSIPVDGSAMLDNRITESLEPYDLSAAVPFKPAVLAGAMADHADVDAAECVDRVRQRVETSVEDKLRSTVSGYSSVTRRSRHIHTEDGRVTPVLMPVWLITTEKEGTTYTFAINGQTGKLTCDVPADGKKAFIWGAGAFAIAMALAAALLLAMDMFDGMMMGVSAFAALLIAFIVVAGLKAQLNQAEFQSAAGNYLSDDTFELSARSDHFLYRTTERRKIERTPQQK